MLAPEIIILLAKPIITRWVYVTTALLGVLFAAISLLVATSRPMDRGTIPMESANMWLEAKVKKEETTRECFRDYSGAKCATPRVVTEIVTEPYYKLRITYPLEIYEEDTGEVKFFAEQQNPHPLITSNVTNTLEVKLQSGKGITFVQNPLSIAVGDQRPRLSYFESEKVNTEVSKKILIQARILPAVDENSADSQEKHYEFNDLGGFKVRILPKEIIFGLTESTLKGIQMLFGALGIPALLLFTVTFFANRVLQREKKQNSKKSEIILPSEGNRIKRHSK